MVTNYPGSLDAYSRPSASTPMNASGYEGHTVVDNLYDAVEAIETELGTDPAGAQATVKARLDGLTHRQVIWESGHWLNNTQLIGSQSTSVAPGANTCYVYPIWIPVSATLDRIAIRVNATLASANIRLGYYPNLSNSLPTGTATDFGEIDASTSGIKTLTISQAVTGGAYAWFAVLNESNTVTVYGNTNGSPKVWASYDGSSWSEPTGLYFSQTYASGFPTIGTITSSDVSNSSSIALLLRRT